MTAVLSAPGVQGVGRVGPVGHVHRTPRILPGVRIVPGTILRPRRSGGITADPSVGLVGLAGITGLLGVAAVRRRRVAARAGAGVAAGPTLVRHRVPYTERVAQTSMEVQTYTRTIQHHADEVIRERRVSYVPETTYESVPITTRVKTKVTSIAHQVWGWITHPIKTIKTVWKNVTTWVLHPVTTLRRVVSWVTHTVHRVWHTTEQATRTIVHTTYRSVQRFKTITEKVTRNVAPRVWRGLQQLPGEATTWAVAKAKHAAASAKAWIGREATRFARDPLAYLAHAPGRLAHGGLKLAKALTSYGRDLITSGPRLAKANLQATTAIIKLTEDRHNTKAQAQLADALLDALDAGLDLADLVSWLLLLIPGAGEAAKIGITAAVRGLKQLGKKEACQELRTLIEKLLADTAEHAKTRLAARDEHGSAPLPRLPHRKPNAENGGFDVVEGGLRTRLINFRPSGVDPSWGFTRRHLSKHIFGSSKYSLSKIDPGGNSEIWKGYMQDLASRPATSTTPNGMLDIIGTFPRSGGSGNFQFGIRLSPRSDGSFDLITLLTKQ